MTSRARAGDDGAPGDEAVELRVFHKDVVELQDDPQLLAAGRAAVHPEVERRVLGRGEVRGGLGEGRRVERVPDEGDRLASGMSQSRAREDRSLLRYE